MIWIDETVMYMYHLLLDTFCEELPTQERIVKGASFVILACFYSFILITGLLFLAYGVLSVLALL